jgi:uncharacterized protein (DUF2235 family)
MGKKLIICADGTWNTENETDQGHPSPTNVAKVARQLLPRDADDVVQMTYYHSGVGTNFGQRVSGGAFGAGLFQNVIDCYRFLIHNYEVGDRLYFFGFSRGAYTVRSLAGLVRNSGILKRGHEDEEPNAVALYRDYSPATRPDSPASQRFRADHAISNETPITFIGVWDTVGALGIPGLDGHLRLPAGVDWQFHDVSLSRSVAHARHALSIHEHRAEFVPTLWEKQPKDPAHPQTLKQVWFPGVHSDVGGGYAESGLSDIALDWMVREASAEAVGLSFSPTLATLLHPNPLAIEHESFSVLYKVIDFLRRKNDGVFRVYGSNPDAIPEDLHTITVTRFQSLANEWWPPTFLEELQNRCPPTPAPDADGPGFPA